jgi:hypothetical protein
MVPEKIGAGKLRIQETKPPTRGCELSSGDTSRGEEKTGALT